MLPAEIDLVPGFGLLPCPRAGCAFIKAHRAKMHRTACFKGPYSEGESCLCLRTRNRLLKRGGAVLAQEDILGLFVPLQ